MNGRWDWHIAVENEKEASREKGIRCSDGDKEKRGVYDRGNAKGYESWGTGVFIRLEPNRSLPPNNPPPSEVVLPARERKENAGLDGRGSVGWASRCCFPPRARLCERG